MTIICLKSFFENKKIHVKMHFFSVFGHKVTKKFLNLHVISVLIVVKDEI